MNDKENSENHQQQILFDDAQQLANKARTEGQHKEKGQEEVKVSQAFESQVVFGTTENLPVKLDEQEGDVLSLAQLHEKQLSDDTKGSLSTKPSWLWRIIASLFMLVVLIESTQFFITGFTQSPFITSIYAALLGVLVLVGTRSLWRELVGLKQFRHQQDLKQQALDILEQSSGSNVSAIKFCQQLSDNLPCDLVFDNDKEQIAWHEAQSENYSPKELIQLYSREVLTKVDEKALNEIAKFSTEAVVLVALSPVAIIDMLIMLSRNLRMINKVASLYGLKLGYWSRIKLIKQVFVNMAYAGASELIADFGSDMLGAELLGKLSARFAQGLGAGMLTARLGVKTMQLCRPIPFDDKPKLSHVRKKIAKQIKLLVASSR